MAKKFNITQLNRRYPRSGAPSQAALFRVSTDLTNPSTLFNSSVTIVGSSQTDTLTFLSRKTGQAAVVLTDGSFSSANTSVEILSLESLTSSGNSVQLGANAFTTGFRTVTGSNQADAINAFAIGRAVTINGLNGANTITGSNGFADVLNGGANNDTFNYLIGSAQDAVNFAQDSISGGGGINTVQFSSYGDTIADAAFANKTAINVVALGDGNNTLTLAATAYAAVSALTVTAGTGNDSINAGLLGKALTVDSGDGDDWISGSYLGDSLVGGLGADQIFGNDGNDTLNGGDGVDSLEGGIGNDRFLYADGEFINAETVDGGAGVNTVAFTADAQTVVDANFANKQNIQALTFANGANSAVLEALAALATSDLTVTSGTGNDTINADLLGESIVVDSGAGDDSILGSDQADTINAGSGNDTIDGGLGNDSLLGGDGNDVFLYANLEFVSGETVNGGTGTNTVLFQANGQTVGDGAFANKSNINAIVFQQGNNTLVASGLAAAATSALTVISGSGDDTIDAVLLGESLTVDAGDGANTIIGSSQADSITAGSGNDSIVSWAGGDTVNAGNGDNYVDAFTGNNSVTAGSGNDTVLASTGNDTVSAGDGNNGIDVSSGNNSVTAGSGNDFVIALGGNDTVSVGDGDNTVAAGDGANSVVTGSGADVIVSGIGNDTILAGDGSNNIAAGDGANSVVSGSGADSIVTGAGNDSISAGDGNNTVRSGDGLDTVVTGSGDDLIEGNGAGADSVQAGDGNDTVYGNNGSDTINAGAGTDFIQGNAGADSLLGGDGNDTFNYQSGEFIAAETVNGGTGVNSIALLDNSQVIADAAFANKSNLSLIGTSNGDNSLTLGVLAAAATANLTVLTGSGNDTVNASALGEALYVETNAGNDSITGSSQADTILAGDDNDTIAGGAGIDSIFAGNQDDTVNYAAGQFVAAETADGGAGTDTLNFTVGGQVIADAEFANKSNFEAITLFNGNNNLTLGTVAAGAFTTVITVTSGANADSITATALNGGNGIDASTNAGNDTVAGSIYDDTINGGDGNDSISGNDGADSLLGAAGLDTIIGGNGNDTITGGLGADSMTGSAGSDVFFYGGGIDASATQTGITAATADIITDFTTTVDSIQTGLAGTGTNYAETATDWGSFTQALAAANVAFFADTNLRYYFGQVGGTGYLFMGNYTGASQVAGAAIGLTGVNSTGIAFGDIVA